ncbi:UNVERIFIED_CONTAM: hypothetical protein GTU68_007538 [Idotea baltica]|nr:hypothetical protein [Idotea baltica]
MRRYLKEFLMDKRVIEWPRALWFPILFGIVLNVRPKKSGAAYAEIWNYELNESPLRTFTRSQSDQLAESLAGYENVVVDWAMRYGQPPIKERIEALQAAGCERVLVFPCHCMKTSRLLEERLGWDSGPNKGRLMTCFQSRFGPEEWLQPYTDKTVERLAKEGVKSVAVFNPGFVSDCLETLEEIAGEAGEIFEEHGGEHFAHIPCLNDTPEGMAVIENMVRRELSGWI